MARISKYIFSAYLILFILTVNVNADGLYGTACSSWDYEDIKNLDPWGDTDSGTRDIVATYAKKVDSLTLCFRVDFLNITDDNNELYIALDFKDGGIRRLSNLNHSLQADIAWELLLKISFSDSAVLYQPDFSIVSNINLTYDIDSQLDYIITGVNGQLVEQINLDSLSIQVFSINEQINDKSSTMTMSDTTGRAKLVLTFMNAFIGYGPHSVSWYDGYALANHKRPGVRRGLKYLLDAVENHKTPLTLNDLRIAEFHGNEYLGILDRFRTLQKSDLLDALFTLDYAHFMPWHSDIVDIKAIELATKLRQEFDINISNVMYPYEGLMTIGDMNVIKNAGVEYLFLLDRYRYIFGWITDWSNPDIVKDDIASVRKIHRLNNINLFFDSRLGNYNGIFADSRWEKINWSTFNEYDQYAGTDNGLHLWWRRILHDMAIDEDQEQYFTIGTDLMLVPWLFQDIADWNIGWIAAHPWIEVTSFSNLSNRNWSVIDHGEMQGNSDEPLEKYKNANDTHYNAYFWQHYYGGIADGHSPLIPQGETIEAFFDYIPYLSNGNRIPSNKNMGDAQTPGTIIYETLQNFQSAPDNDLTELAWFHYLFLTGDMTFHSQIDYQPGQPDQGGWGGQYLHYSPKFKSNYIGHVNKVLFAAKWADDVMNGSYLDSTVIQDFDLDLDGENEYVLFNEYILLIFENDGGRVEYAFSLTENNIPLQVVAPTSQLTSINASNQEKNFKKGETALLSDWNQFPDALFVEDREFNEYTVQLTDTSIELTSPNSMIMKSITIDKYCVSAKYTNNTDADLEVGLGCVSNLMSIYSQKWPEKFVPIVNSSFKGWYNTDGGVTGISFKNAYLSTINSFLDSPARQEQMERDNYDGYTSGHWFYYPFNAMTLWGSSKFEIHISLEPILIHFSADNVNGTYPLTVQFADSSIGGINSWLWDFNDGHTSTEQNPVHTYTTAGTYSVTLTVTGPGGTYSETKDDYINVSDPASVSDQSLNLPDQFKLYTNYPNPFNPSTTIIYDVPIEAYVEISIYDMSGKLVHELINQKIHAGTHKIRWNASEWPSGNYVIKLSAGNFQTSQKCLLIK